MNANELTDRPINIFVVGDIVIDHAIFVVAKTRRFHTIDDEKVYDVRRRVNTAGGAANCARILGSLSRGNTYLWGITGRSLWGAFSDVLEASEVSDVSAPKVIMTGYHDDTVRMNTITRVIRVDTSRHVHQARFDDVGSVGPSHLASQSLMHQLHKVHNESHLAAIIISDLDMSALDSKLIAEIAIFATQNHISLFVDPKRNFAKYEHIHGTAILPNLYEWCDLIGEHDNVRKWRGEIKTRDGLERFAHRSLQRFGTFQYHIVKCDKDGAVVIGSAPDNPHRFSVVRLPPHQIDPGRTFTNQLGSGDVLTAITAMEFAAADATNHPTDRMIRAVRVGSWIVAVHRHMPWGQMPSREDAQQVTGPIPKPLEEIDVSAGVRYLPSGDVVDLTEAMTEIPPLLSVSENYRAALHDLVDKVQNQWHVSPLRSIILTARGGSGKSEICKSLSALLDPSGIDVLVATDALMRNNNVEKMIKKIDAERPPTASAFLLVVVDEAFGRSGKLFQRKSGVLLLDALHQKGIRLLMIDADFTSARANLSESQFLTRCDLIELPDIDDRPRDIAYVFLAGCMMAAKNDAVTHFDCERRALVSIIDVTLQGTALDQSPRTIFHCGRVAFETAAKDKGPSVTVRAEHLGARFVDVAGETNGGTIQVRFT